MSGIETKFGSAEPAYSAYRPGYPESLFERIISEIFPPYRRVLDVGSGTGLSALPLTKWFEEVVAVEPDQNMAAKLHGVSTKLSVRQCRAEDIEEDYDSFDLVTSGNAFYWTDGELIVEKAANFLRHRGVFAVYRYGFPQLPPTFQEIIQEHLMSFWNQFRHPRLIDEGYSVRTIQASPRFEVVQVDAIPNIVPLKPKQIVGFFSSTSYCSAYLRTLSHPDNYLSDFEALLHAYSNDVPILVDFSLELIIAKRR
jgi:SAM-dependent methyltransferase